VPTTKVETTTQATTTTAKPTTTTTLRHTEPTTASPAAQAPATQTPAPTVTEKATPTDNDITVYIGKTGNKYHTSRCRTLKNGGTAISLSNAKAQGRTACSICGG
jgi:micrococcal nuclease